MRLRPAVATCGVLLLAGCASTSQPGHGPTTAAPPPNPLPNPVASALPLGTTTLFAESGHGKRTLSLSKLDRNKVKSVTVKWVCEGGGGTLSVTDGSKTLVSSGCENHSTQPAIFGADVPLSITTSLTWTIDTDASTAWRMDIYTD